MNTLDVIISVVNIIGLKAIETTTEETIKKILIRDKTEKAKNWLFDLYADVTELHSASLNFLQSLEPYIEGKKKRTVVISIFDMRWERIWVKILSDQAYKVAKSMAKADNTLNKIKYGADIFMPETAETLLAFRQVENIEYDLIDLIRMDSEMRWTRKIIISQMRRISKRYFVDIKTLEEKYQFLRENVDELCKAKDLIAKFIREQFKFVEIL
jgi:hypothetical protein